MNRKFLIVILMVIFVSAFIIIFKNKLFTQKQAVDFNKVEKEITQDLGIKEEKADIPLYAGSKVNKDACGKDAFYVEEKSAEFVKNYCRFLKNNGWKLIHQDYQDCEDIKSFGGGYNYEKGQEKISISVVKYGEEATCFWVYKK